MVSRNHLSLSSTLPRSNCVIAKTSGVVYIISISYRHRLHHFFTYASKAFLAASTIFLTSCTPFSTTFSICVPAFFKSSGLADLANCIALSFFCCPCLAFLTELLATSPAFAAAATACFRDSAVGGGMGMLRRRGFWPVGSTWGVRFRFADWIDEVTGLRCCCCNVVSSDPEKRRCIAKDRDSYLLLANHDLHNSSLGHHLRQIPKLHRSTLLELHSQTLEYLRVESPALSQLREIAL